MSFKVKRLLARLRLEWKMETIIAVFMIITYWNSKVTKDWIQNFLRLGS